MTTGYHHWTWGSRTKVGQSHSGGVLPRPGHSHGFVHGGWTDLPDLWQFQINGTFWQTMTNHDKPWNSCGTEVQTRPYFWLRCGSFQSRVWGLMDNHIPGIAYPSCFVCNIQIPFASQIQGVWLISSTVDGFHSILPHETDWNVHKKLSHVFLTAQTHWKSTAEPWIETPIPSYYTDRQIGLPLIVSPPILYLATNHQLYQFPLHVFDGWSLKLVRNPLLYDGFSPYTTLHKIRHGNWTST